MPRPKSSRSAKAIDRAMGSAECDEEEDGFTAISTLQTCIASLPEGYRILTMDSGFLKDTPNAFKETDIVAEGASVIVRNFYLFNDDLYLRPFFCQTSDMQDVEPPSLALVGEATIDGKDYLLYLRVLKPWITWSEQYEFNEIGLTSWNLNEGTDGKERLEARYYHLLFSSQNDAHEIYRTCFEYTIYSLKLMSRLMALADRAADPGDDGEEEANEMTEQARIEAMREEFEELQDELVSDAKNYCQQSKMSHHQLVNDVHYFLVEQTATTPLTLYHFEHTLPGLLNREVSECPRKVEKDRMKMPDHFRQASLASELKVVNARVQYKEPSTRDGSLFYVYLSSVTFRLGGRGNSAVTITISPGDYVRHADFETVTKVRSIRYPCQRGAGGKVVKMLDQLQIHGPEFCHISTTAVGDAGLPNELVYSYECASAGIDELDSVVDVKCAPRMTQQEWRATGSNEMLETYLNPVADFDPSTQYFVRQCYDPSGPYFRYDHHTLEAACSDEFNVNGKCMCQHVHAYQNGESFLLDTSASGFQLRYKNSVLHKGDTLMFEAGTFCRAAEGSNKARSHPRFLEALSDRAIYNKKMQKYRSRPDYYTEIDRWENDEPAAGGKVEEYTFKRAYDLALLTDARLDENMRVKMALRLFYRPEDTDMTNDSVKDSNKRELYLSSEVVYIADPKAAQEYRGMCYVTADSELRRDTESLEKWLLEGNPRFFCFSQLDRDSRLPDKENELDPAMGRLMTERSYAAPLRPKLQKPLRTCDLYSGAGGLSTGLHMSGLSDSRYAVEFTEAHSRVFKSNFPQANVFCTDVNKLCKDMETKKSDAKGQAYPKLGDVDLICGGPPCQGFSGMNCARHGKNSQTKRALIVPFFAFCDRLRPRFVIMENVSGLGSTGKTGRIVDDAKGKSTPETMEIISVLLECARAIGYQVTVRKLQASQFAVPQDRRRIFIVCAAPGESLLEWPEPLTTCPSIVLTGMPHNSFLKVNSVVYKGKWGELASAPYRGVSVYDALKDLSSFTAKTEHHHKEQFPDHVVVYSGETQKHRVAAVPKDIPYADWRFIPNTEVVLSNGKKLKKLGYQYLGQVLNRDDVKEARGVCESCHDRCVRARKGDKKMLSAKCQREEKRLEKDTLIPIALPHNGYRLRQWQGLFGRAFQHGVFQTIVTVPNPYNKQGQVLHPTEDRLLSVREIARGQGFPDSFKFTANDNGRPIDVRDKYTQVGNAVPPPLAAALGEAIITAMVGGHGKQQKFNSNCVYLD